MHFNLPYSIPILFDMKSKSYNKEHIAKLCRTKIDTLMERYFDELYQNVLKMKPEMLLYDYSSELTLQIEQEYRLFLREQWEQIRGDDEREFQDIMTKAYARLSIDSVYRQQLQPALRDAQQVTLWEQLTQTNYKDEERFREMLSSYITALLRNMMLDFLEDL